MTNARTTLLALNAALLVCVAGCGGAPVQEPVAAASATAWHQEGVASYMGREHAGLRTANGDRFDPDALTAAHRTLPFGTRVRVIDLDSGRDVVVVINDRGPFRRGRIIDVSEHAARALGFHRAGTARVLIERLDDEDLADR